MPFVPKTFPALLVTGLGVLQAVFAIIAGINGGLTGIVVNARLFVLLALGALILAVLLGGVIAIFDVSARGVRLLTWTALVLVSYATGVAAYAAVVTPSEEGRPNITASLEPGSPLVLKATVKAVGIPRSATFNIYVNGLEESQDEYIEKNPTLYQAHVGSDASGNVEDTFSVPIPVGTYDDVVINAWAGEEDPCKPQPNASGFTPSSVDKACLYMRLVHIGKRR